MMTPQNPFFTICLKKNPVIGLIAQLIVICCWDFDRFNILLRGGHYLYFEWLYMFLAKKNIFRDFLEIGTNFG